MIRYDTIRYDKVQYDSFMLSIEPRCYSYAPFRRLNQPRMHMLTISSCILLSFRQLSNGVTVATEAGSGPVASLTVSIDLGSRYESPENNGVCAVIGASGFYVSTQAFRCVDCMVHESLRML